MQKGQCTKGFPKPFADNFAHGQGGEAILQRRKPGSDGKKFKTQIKCKHKNNEMVDITNQHVVPYNKVLLRKHKMHICVEIVNTILSIKYGIKYTTKGADKVS